MADYSDLLRTSIDAAGSSRRKLSFQLAEKTANQQTSEYRALGKYLSGDETPSRERAAIIAVLLGNAELALVTDQQSRRQVRLAELEGEAAETRRAFLALLRVVGELVEAVQDAGGSISDDATRELAQAVLRMQGGAQSQ